MKHWFVYLFFFAFLCAVDSRAQLHADFTVEVSQGCSPLTVDFTDLSTPADSIVSRRWVFGNGNLSDQNNPAPEASYSDPGSYDVMLIISNGTQTDTLLKPGYITVFNDPVPGFTTDSLKAACAPLYVGFRDASTATDAPIMDWVWDFGDGYTDFVQHPVHRYDSSGIFPVSLTVIDANGCDESTFKPGYIQIYNKPRAAFTSNITQSCAAPVLVNFTNLSSGSNLSYRWSFGDSTASTVVSPNHLYLDYGLYDVMLVAINQTGCSDTLVDSAYMRIMAVALSFDPPDDTVCKDVPGLFTNTSSGATDYEWAFGDNNTSALVNPSHSYASYGTFTVSLTGLVNGEACSNVYTRTLLVEEVVAGFSSSEGFLCRVPDTVFYQDLSVNAASWFWEFGNGMTASTPQPANVFTTTPGLNINTAESYDDKLTVTSAHGCSDAITKTANVRVAVPRLNTGASAYAGCAPLATAVSGSTVYNTVEDQVTAYQWDFSDSTVVYAQNTSHTFTEAGSYTARFSITTAAGCSYNETVYFAAGEQQLADFEVMAPVSCAIDSIPFEDRSVDSTRVNSWSWDFGSSCSWSNAALEKNPYHLYCDTGYFDVFLRSSNNGCADTITQANAVYVMGPVALFEFDHSCDTPLTYRFTGNIIHADGWQWDFGDGAVDSTSVNPVHAYDTAGNYTVTLAAWNNSTGCTYASDQLVQARSLVADFLLDTAIGCPGLTVTIDPAPANDEAYFLNNMIVGRYLWDAGDSVPQMRNAGLTHTYDQAGTYFVSLQVRDLNGCIDSIKKPVRIYQPTVHFGATPLFACAPVDIAFSDSSASDTLVSHYVWRFGDGTQAYDTNPVHRYTRDSIYSISLTVTDTLGCRDSLTRSNYLNIQKVVPLFFATDNTLCLGDSASFVNVTSSQVQQFYWDFGDGKSSQVRQPKHLYQTAGNYTVTLYTADSSGCDTSLRRTSYVRVQDYPQVDFGASQLQSECYPLLVKFADSTKTPNLFKWKWTFGDGATSSLKNPAHVYALPNKYDVQLKVTTTNGCSDSILKSNYIEVKGPYATYHIPDVDICRGDTGIMVIDSLVDVHQFEWDFGDGIFGANTGDTARHRYLTAGSLQVSMIYWDEDSTCVKSDKHTLSIHRVTAGYSIADTVVCVLYAAQLYDGSTGFPGAVTAWRWDFGDSTLSTDEHPAHAWGLPGTYQIMVAAFNAFACSDTLWDSIQVVGIPLASLMDDTVVCRGDTIVLDPGGGFLGYRWFNGDTTQTTLAFDSTTAWVMVQSGTGCWSFPDTTEIILLPDPAVHLGEDTTLCPGDTLWLDATGTIYESYLWHDSSTAPVFAVDSSGKYVVQVTNLCNQASDTITVEQIAIPVAVLGADTIICPGDSFQLNIQGSFFDQYRWQDGDTNFIYTLQDSGVYAVSVYNRCAAAYDTLVLALIPINQVLLGPDTAICPGDSFILSAYTNAYDRYLWQDSVTDTSFFMIDTAGIYFVEVRNLCRADTDSVMVALIPHPLVQLGNDTTLCLGDTLWLNAAGSHYDAYRWHNQSADSLLMAVDSGWFSVQVYNVCSADTDAVRVHLFPLLMALGSDTSYCEGGAIVLSPDHPFDTYLWSDGSTDSTLVADSTGLYQLTVTNRCTTLTDEVLVDVRANPQVFLGNDTAISWQTWKLDAGNPGAQYLWSTGETTQTIAVVAGEYDVWVMVDQEKCYGYDTIRIMQKPDPGACTIELPRAFTPNGDGRNDLLHARGYCVQTMHLALYNRWGGLVFESRDMNEGWDGTYKGKLQETDVYVYVLEGTYEDGVKFFKKGNVTLLN